MAGAGRGNAHYAPTPDAAPGIFYDDLGRLGAMITLGSVTDRVVREVYYMDDPEIPRLDGGRRVRFMR